MGRSWIFLAALLCSSWVPICPGQDAATPSTSVTADLAPLLASLFAALETLSDYRTPAVLPPIFQLPQSQVEALVCDQPCNVTAAYLPKRGIYLSENLDASRNPVDRAALLHELVHYLQHGHPKFAGLSVCERDRAEEQEAYDLQNAYLAMLHIDKRVVFYDGDFDCGLPANASAASAP